jgi:hypothetical protein
VSRPALNLPSVHDDEDEDDALALPAPAGPRRSGGVLAELTGADVETPLSVDHLPTPYDVAETVTAPLDDRERGHLAVCEQALHGFRRSVIVAGKALEVIRRGRLYRETHATFVEYLDEVWDIRKSQAYRMIEAWPVAAAVSPIGDINEGQARELVAAAKSYGLPAAVELYRGVRELRGDRKVTAADLAEARAVLPSRAHLASPDQVRDVLAASAATGKAPRLAAPVQPDPEQPASAPAGPPVEAGDDISREELDEGAEAIATLEAALAQQRQIYDRIGGGVLAAALLYDPGRADRLRHELRQYANRTAYRLRAPGEDSSSGA